MPISLLDDSWKSQMVLKETESIRLSELGQLKKPTGILKADLDSYRES
jgi:hypothetical protein